MKRSLGRKTLAVPSPVWIVGTYDAAGKPNLMTAAWGGICCSKPPSVCVSLRAATYSHQAIIDRASFTVGIPHTDQVAIADYLGIATGRDTDKFAAAGLTPLAAEHVDAPLAAEFPLSLECRLSHTVELGLHTLFVGEILDVKAEEEVLGENGRPCIDQVSPIVFAAPQGAYFSVGPQIAPAFDVGKSIDAPSEG